MTREPHDHWTMRRDAAVWGEHGIASLAATHWLDATAREFDGAPGLWRTEGADAIGEGIPGLSGPLVLAPGGEATLGELLIRAITRDGAIAVRVLDPRAAERRGISEIVRHPFDPELQVRGRFAASDRSVSTRAVDGHESTAIYDGTVTFEVDGAQVALVVERDSSGLFAAFSDGTSGSESYRFRFLRMPPPTDDGTVEVDLNRAYLPPCAFSDHYVCVFPPAENRWTLPVRAGERFAR